MKRLLMTMACLAAFMVFLGSGAHAELLSGSIYSIDSLQNTVTVEHPDELTGNLKRTVLSVVPTTVFSEHQTLDTLKSGDVIWIETERDSDGNQLAKSIEVVNA